MPPISIFRKRSTKEVYNREWKSTLVTSLIPKYPDFALFHYPYLETQSSSSIVINLQTHVCMIIDYGVKMIRYAYYDYCILDLL